MKQTLVWEREWPHHALVHYRRLAQRSRPVLTRSALTAIVVIGLSLMLFFALFEPVCTLFLLLGIGLLPLLSIDTRDSRRLRFLAHLGAVRCALRLGHIDVVRVHLEQVYHLREETGRDLYNATLLTYLGAFSTARDHLKRAHAGSLTGNISELHLLSADRTGELICRAQR